MHKRQVGHMVRPFFDGCTNFWCSFYDPLNVLILSQTKRKRFDEMRRMNMNTAKLRKKRWDIEKVMITAGMLMMEGFGTVMLFCGIMNIKIL